MVKIGQLIFLTLLFCCCVNGNKSSVEGVDTTQLPNMQKAIEVDKVARLKVWLDSTQIIHLPFKANFDSAIIEKFRVKFWSADSVFKSDFKSTGDVYLVGLLSDTTNFYAFTFMSVAAFANPAIITFDKTGKKIDLRILTTENCVVYAGDVLLCDEYAIIGTDLSLNYYFKSIVANEGDSQDTVCTHYISKGKIRPDGRIDFGELKKLQCNTIRLVHMFRTSLV